MQAPWLLNEADHSRSTQTRLGAAVALRASAHVGGDLHRGDLVGILHGLTALDLVDVVHAFDDLAPKHVERIKQLVREGFYDGIVFHRVIDGFMAQTGCPQGTGTGGSQYGNLPAEFNAEPHVRGVCSMARAQNPNSANSHFFICFDDASFLDKQYTVWGKVIEGMDNVDKIKRGEPVQNPDKITSLKVAADVK
jgi:cyclophilin family peptidyl-prolyl cis-trans isomerase